MPPYRGELFSKVNVYLSEVDWTINHIVRAFNLPTAYNAPGQEDIQFEEGKKKITIDPRVTDVSGYTLQQLEDVVNGWMYFLNGVLKGLKEMVGLFCSSLFQFNSICSYFSRLPSRLVIYFYFLRTYLQIHVIIVSNLILYKLY